jgi:hypothetical protein
MSHTAYVRSPCGQYAAAGREARVLVWDAVHEAPRLVLRNGYATAICVVNWAADGGVLLAGDTLGSVLAWRVDAGGELLFARRLPQVFAPVREVTCSPAPHRIAALFEGGLIQVWDLGVREAIFSAMAPGAACVWWLPDGVHLAADSGGAWYLPAPVEARPTGLSSKCRVS